MRTVGVIAEYNPFHPGHAYQLGQARRMAQADCVVVVMSSCFTQRGDAAVLSPAVRARMALRQGADVVFALPACWAVRDAEHFALGGIRLLQLAGVDAVSFGAETADLPLLSQAASLMENPDQLSLPLQKHLALGLPYPAALAAAAREAAPEAGALLNSPNNTLAICYLRAMQRLGFAPEVYPVARSYDYHATQLETLPSATAIRAALHRGDWQTLRKALPPEVFELLHAESLAGRVHRNDALNQALLYRLRTMTTDDWHSLPDVSEGIDDRLRKAAETASTREDLLQAAKTRRYPYARLSRMCTHALLSMTADSLDATPLPDALWLLGFRDAALPLLSRLKHEGVHVISKASAGPREQAWYRTELLAYDLWALGCHEPAGLALRQGVVRE